MHAFWFLGVLVCMICNLQHDNRLSLRHGTCIGASQIVVITFFRVFKMATAYDVTTLCFHHVCPCYSFAQDHPSPPPSLVPSPRYGDFAPSSCQGNPSSSELDSCHCLFVNSKSGQANAIAPAQQPDYSAIHELIHFDEPWHQYEDIPVFRRDCRRWSPGHRVNQDLGRDRSNLSQRIQPKCICTSENLRQNEQDFDKGGLGCANHSHISRSQAYTCKTTAGHISNAIPGAGIANFCLPLSSSSAQD